MLFIINEKEHIGVQIYKSNVQESGKEQIIYWSEYISALANKVKLWEEYDSLCVIGMPAFYKITKDKFVADEIGSMVTMCIKQFEVNMKNIVLINPAPITDENYGTGWAADLTRNTKL